MKFLKYFQLPKDDLRLAAFQVLVMMYRLCICEPLFDAGVYFFDSALRAFLVLYTRKCVETYLSGKNVATAMSKERFVVFVAAYCLFFLVLMHRPTLYRFLNCVLPFSGAMQALSRYKHYYGINSQVGRASYVIGCLCSAVLLKCGLMDFFQAVFIALMTRFVRYDVAQYLVVIYALLDGLTVVLCGLPAVSVVYIVAKSRWP